MRIVGPNSQGLANFGTGAIASFSTMFMDMDRAEGHVAMLEPERRAVHRCRSGSCASAASASVTPMPTGNDADIYGRRTRCVAVAEDPR